MASSVTLGKLKSKIEGVAHTQGWKKNLRVVSLYCEKWGTGVAIHTDPGLRDYMARAISNRLSLPYLFVKDKLDSFHRMNLKLED